MATIAFCMWPMASEINGSLSLARKLAKRGHQVVYVGVPDCRKIVEDNGHRFVSILDRWVPRGSLLSETVEYRMVRALAPVRFFQAVSHKRRFEKLLSHLLRTPDNEVERAIRSINPDLFVIGAHTSHTSVLGFIALKLRVRCLYLLQQMILRPLQENAPEESKPGGMKSLFQRFTFEFTNINYRWYYQAFLDQSGAPPELIDNDDTRFPMRVPILYPWPKRFELEEVAQERFTYVEAGVEMKRFEDDRKWSGLEGEGPLIYCSFGGMLPLGLEGTRQLLSKVIDSMHSLGQCRLVLSLGPFFKEEEFPNPPGNVKIVRYAPQMKLLGQASLMITHGGSSSVKECILSGVPMVVIPLGYETPEYAQRVRHHGLGLACDPSLLSSQTLARMVKRILSEASFSQTCERMRQAFQAWEEQQPSVHFIEGYLRCDPLKWHEDPALRLDLSATAPASA